MTGPTDEAVATSLRSTRRRRIRRLLRGRLAPARWVLLGLAALAMAALWLLSSWGLLDPCRSAGEVGRICRVPPRWMSWLQFGLGVAGSTLAVIGGLMLLRAAFRKDISRRLKPVALAAALIAGGWTVIYLIGSAVA